VLIAVIVILALVSCAKSSKEENSLSSQDNPASSVPEAEKPQRTLSFGGEGQNPETNTQAENISRKQNIGDMDRTRRFFDHAGTETHYPQDRVIGALSIVDLLDRESKNIYTLAEKWALALKDQRLTDTLEEMYAAEARSMAALKDETRNPLQHAVRMTRFGRIRFENGSARMDVRLFSDIGRTSGEMVFILNNDEWRILSDSFVLDELDIEYQFPDYSERPEIYGTFQM